MNQQIKTSIGAGVIIILSITIGFFTWKIVKMRGLDQMPSADSVSLNKKTVVKDENSDWKTYSDKIGYTLKYPANWEATSYEETDPGNSWIGEKGSPNPTGIEDLKHIEIKVFENLDNLSLDQWINNQLLVSDSKDYANFKKIISERNIGSGGLSGMEVIFEPVGGSTAPSGPYVFFSKSNKVYEILDVCDTNIFHQIISTFKFTK